MHGITTAYLCAEYNLNTSFCRCFFNSKYLPNNILLKQNSPKRNITFLLGIGYVNEDQKLSYMHLNTLYIPPKELRIHIIPKYSILKKIYKYL